MARWGTIVVRLALLGAGSALLSAPGRAADQVEVTGGVVEGTEGTDPSVRVFKGVPFAAPPVGDLRWKAPQPVVPWDGVRKADEWGTRCVQGPVLGPLRTRDARMGEDCLYLNVWTIARSGREKLPVLVVIYGGGFAAGSASEPRTDGEWFAKQGIVVVEANYRLGVFGFLAHPELTREGGGQGLGQLRNARPGGGTPLGQGQRRRLRGRSRQRDDQRGVRGLLVRERPHGLAAHQGPRAQGDRTERSVLPEPEARAAREERGGEGEGRSRARGGAGRGLPGRASREARGRASRGADEGRRPALQPGRRRVLHAREGVKPLRRGEAGEDPARSPGGRPRSWG